MYELWSVRSDNRPELCGAFEGIFLAALRFASLTAVSEPEAVTFWVQCPERATNDNPEGIDARDEVILLRARVLAQKRHRRRSQASLRCGTVAQTRLGLSMVELLFMSLAVCEGKAKMASRYGYGERIPTAAELDGVHEQLRNV